MGTVLINKDIKHINLVMVTMHLLAIINQVEKKKKVTYCWNFNKGVACRFSPKCKFVERCSYCDSGAHGLHACPKLDNKKKQELLTNVHGGETVYPKENSKYVK